MNPSAEAARIRELFLELQRQPRYRFPAKRQPLDAPNSQGVYVLRTAKGRVVHVGRTYRGKAGLRQRLKNHLAAQSSFTIVFLKRNGNSLRRGYTYQFLAVPSDRQRALLEYLATARYCPKHLGVHTSKAERVDVRAA